MVMDKRVQKGSQSITKMSRFRLKKSNGAEEGAIPHLIKSFFQAYSERAESFWKFIGGEKRFIEIKNQFEKINLTTLKLMV